MDTRSLANKVYNNDTFMLQARIAVDGLLNDGRISLGANERDALDRLAAQVKDDHKLDPHALATLKKFEGLEPDARHAILAKAGQLAGKDDMVKYVDAAIKILEHYNPANKDLSSAVDAAAQSSGLPKLQNGKGNETLR
jgi:hypothetical protein